MQLGLVGLGKMGFNMRERLRNGGANFRGDISEAGAGRARLLEDPSGNLIELFEFKHSKASDELTA